MSAFGSKPKPVIGCAVHVLPLAEKEYQGSLLNESYPVTTKFPAEFTVMLAPKKYTPLGAFGMDVGVVQVEPSADVVYTGIPLEVGIIIAANTPALLTVSAYTLPIDVALITEVEVQLIPSVEVAYIG